MSDPQPDPVTEAARDFVIREMMEQLQIPASRIEPWVKCIATLIRAQREDATRLVKEDCRVSHTVEVQRINALQADLSAAREKVRGLRKALLGMIEEHDWQRKSQKIIQLGYICEPRAEAVAALAAAGEEVGDG